MLLNKKQVKNENCRKKNPPFAALYNLFLTNFAEKYRSNLNNLSNLSIPINLLIC